MSTISFAGYTWNIRNSPIESAGPGPNYFSGTPENVRIDERGLWLRTTKDSDKWQCAEVGITEPLGFGTYTFTVTTSVHDLDAPHVFAAFLYENNSQELDIEFSRTMVGKHRGWFVVQPGSISGNVQKFKTSPENITSHSISWTPTTVTFTSVVGLDISSQQVLGSWQYPSSGIASPLAAKFIFNLWLYNGKPPRRAEEVCISNFSFTPFA